MKENGRVPRATCRRPASSIFPEGMPPKDHQRFLDGALPRLQADARIVGVAGAGSLITKTMDRFSDLDLIVVTANEHREAVSGDRQRIIEGLGNLLAGFTGEHVGEPRVLICLYDDPLLHVDLKFVSLDEFSNRIENPVVLWERESELSSIIAGTGFGHPMPDPQWIEDRFWVWLHYAALKLGRGELFEVIDFLSFIRQSVLGPLSLVDHGQLPRGVRRLETLAPRHLAEMKKTIAGYDRASCAEACRAAIGLYRRLREEAAVPGLRLSSEAEVAAIRYFEEVVRA